MLDRAENQPGSEAERRLRSARRRPGIPVGATLLLVLGLASGLSTGCAHTPADLRTGAARAEPADDCQRVESERFTIESDPWINLHHFLFQWSRNVPERPPGDRRPAVEVPESAGIGELDADERAAWERAVRFYREKLVSHDLVHSRELVALRGPLEKIACSEGKLDDVQADLRAVLVEAMPVYRRHWWPEHQAKNLEWIGNLSKALAPYESALSERLAAAYDGRWPEGRVRVDVTAYANWAGSYTTNRPNEITLARDSGVRDLGAVELLFHEVSHASFFEQPLLGQVSRAFRARGAKRPPSLVHVMQFVTPSELLRLELHGRARRRFVPFAVRGGLYERIPTWAALRKVVEKHWVPFLDGKADRAEALAGIATELAPPTPQADRQVRSIDFLEGDVVRLSGLPPGASGAHLLPADPSSPRSTRSPPSSPGPRFRAPVWSRALHPARFFRTSSSRRSRAERPARCL